VSRERDREVSIRLNESHLRLVRRLDSPQSSWQMWQYEGVTGSFRTGRLERELQMVQIFATRYSYIAILWASLVSFATITLFMLLPN
jgi:hypothetical protein